MSRLLLVADVGNSSVSLALFRNARRLRLGRIGEAVLKKPAEATAELVRLFGPLPVAGVDVLIGSVNPPSARRLERLLPKALGTARPRLIGRDIQIPVTNKARAPQEVGADRLLNTLAAFSLTGEQTIVVDYGTCVAFDIVSADGAFLGGIITPGHKLIAQSLAHGTALLPEIQTTRRPKLIGRDSASAIQSGTFYGIVSTVNGILAELTQELGPVRVMATGGHARFFAPHSPAIERIEPGLTLEGLRLTDAADRAE